MLREIGSLENASTIVLTPSKCNSDPNQYVKRLRSFTNDGFALASHETFMAGLLDKNQEVQILHEELDVESSDLDSSCDASFDATPLRPYRSPRSKDVLRRMRVVAPINLHWLTWVKAFKDATSTGELKSSRNLPLKHLLAIPVGAFDNSTDPAHFDLAASAFLGMDSGSGDGDVAACVQYVLLQLFDTCGIPEISRQAQAAGVATTQSAFGHQVKGLGQFYRYWLKKPEEIDALMNQSEIEWTPVPKLFEDLGTTLTYWGFGNKSDDLCLEEEKFPATLFDLIKLGGEFTNRKQRAYNYAREKDVSVLLDAEEFVPIEVVAESGSESVRLNKAKFYSSPSDELNKCWRELAGLCRYMSILSESAFEYGPDKPKTQQVKVLIQVHQGSRCTIRLENDCISKDVRDAIDGDKRQKFSGVRGHEILKFIEETSLATLKNFESLPDDKDEKFVVTVAFDSPEWMEKTKDKKWP